MRCSVFIAMTLDGFIARLDGRFDFLDSVALPGEDYGFAEFFQSVDALVIGRGTYDVVQAFPEWPYPGKRVVVLTTRPPATRRANEEFVTTTDLHALSKRLASEGCNHVYVDGGKLISQFLDADLIDALTLAIVPLRLGAGLPLFAPGVERRFTLQSCRAWPESGLAQLRYVRRSA